MNERFLESVLSRVRRVRVNDKTLYEGSFRIKESRITIKTNPETFLAAVLSILEHRAQLEAYVKEEPEFLIALEPIKVWRDAPEVVKRMDEASRIAGVGPMASVAGVIADLSVEAAIDAGAEGVLVENGGEVSLDGAYTFHIALNAKGTVLSGNVGFRITPEWYPIGIATSSATRGHAISFGIADGVTVFSKNAAYADALATRLCNAVVGDSPKQAMEAGLSVAKDIREVRGAILVVRDKVGMVGRLPEFVYIEGREPEKHPKV